MSFVNSKPYKNKNWVNLKQPSNGGVWDGSIGIDPQGHAIWPDSPSGCIMQLRAFNRVMERKVFMHNLRTLHEIMFSPQVGYAPPHENDIDYYANFLEARGMVLHSPIQWYGTGGDHRILSSRLEEVIAFQQTVIEIESLAGFYLPVEYHKTAIGIWQKDFL